MSDKAPYVNLAAAGGGGFKTTVPGARRGSSRDATRRAKSAAEKTHPGAATTDALCRSHRGARLRILRQSVRTGSRRHHCQAEGIAVSGNGETVAALDQIKNRNYSQAEGREELFERA